MGKKTKKGMDVHISGRGVSKVRTVRKGNKMNARTLGVRTPWYEGLMKKSE